MRNLFNNYLGLLVIMMAITSSCEKNESENPSSQTQTPTPAYVPPQPGALRLNLSNLTLHVGENATVEAQYYNVDGSIGTTPVLLWQSADNDIATVVNGTITAHSLGFTTITVTDGTHGILRVNLSIVENSVTIGSNPVNINYNIWPSFMGLRYNMTRTISYTLYDARGNPVSGTPTFIPPINSGLLISGNNITAPNFDGLWDVLCVVGNDTLPQKLKVMVFNSSDTSTVIGAVPNCPAFFSYYNSSAEAIQIDVWKIWWDPINGLALNIFTASPQKITLGQPAVATLNEGGYVTSIGPGNSKIRIEYDEAFAEGYVFVNFDFTGSWGGNASNGDNYNFCFSKEGPDVFYSYNPLNYSSYYGGGMPFNPYTYTYKNGDCKITKNGVAVAALANGVSIVPSNNIGIYAFPDLTSGGENNSMTGTFDGWFSQFSANGVTAGTFLWQNDINKMKFIDGNNTVVLTKGSGDCGAGGLSGNDGDPRFHLVFDNHENVDLDIHVKDPIGEEIYFGNISSLSGGQLDIDCNCSSCPSGPNENIYWTTGPSGTYEFWASYFGPCGAAGVSSSVYTFYVTINGGTVATYSGTLTAGESPHYFFTK